MNGVQHGVHCRWIAVSCMGNKKHSQRKCSQRDVKQWRLQWRNLHGDMKNMRLTPHTRYVCVFVCNHVCMCAWMYICTCLCGCAYMYGYTYPIHTCVLVVYDHQNHPTHADGWSTAACAHHRHAPLCHANPSTIHHPHHPHRCSRHYAHPYHAHTHSHTCSGVTGAPVGPHTRC